jgi:hypothetical protein
MSDQSFDKLEEAPLDLPVDLDHIPADYAEAVEMLRRVKRLMRSSTGARFEDSSAFASYCIKESARREVPDWLVAWEIVRDLQSATRWISVRDRLPEAHNHRVGHLAYNAGGVFFTTVHPSWWNSIDPRGPDYNGPSVTHWMEIPGAPVDRNADR